MVRLVETDNIIPQLQRNKLIAPVVYHRVINGQVFWLGDRPPTDADLSPFLIIRRVKVLAALQYLAARTLTLRIIKNGLRSASVGGRSPNQKTLIRLSNPLGVIVKLRPGGRRSSISHRALRGHFIVIPQDPGIKNGLRSASVGGRSPNQKTLIRLSNLKLGLGKI
jgi:hypothetical protein